MPEIIICAIFNSVNALEKLYLHELILVIPSYEQLCQKLICIYQDCKDKGFIFTVKEV